MPQKKKADAVVPTLAQVQEEIKTLAQELYRERAAKGITGDELSDWLQAEGRVKAKYRL
jgi:hypothetical protein